MVSWILQIMDLFARAETERLAKAEQEKRRKMRIVQVISNLRVVDESTHMHENN